MGRVVGIEDRGMVEIVQVTEVTPELVTGLGRLVPQLDPSCRAPTAEDLRQIVGVSDYGAVCCL